MDENICAQCKCLYCGNNAVLELGRQSGAPYQFACHQCTGTPTKTCIKKTCENESKR